MTDRRIFALGGIILAGIVVAIIVFWRSAYRQDHFSCEAQLTIMDEAASYDILMNFTFADGSGIYEASGLYKDPQGQTTSTSNKVTFDYWRKGKNLYLISKETNELPKTDVPMIGWKPDFFRKRDRGLALQVIQENADGYLFLYDRTPLFYCTRNRE